MINPKNRPSPMIVEPSTDHDDDDEHGADRLADQLDQVDHRQRHLANNEPGVTAEGKGQTQGQSEQPYWEMARMVPTAGRFP